MSFIKEGILVCYLFAIFLVIAGITIVFLAGRRHTTKLHKALKSFLFGMLVMSLYDMLIFYTDYVLGDIKGILTLRIGSCIIAVLFYLWLNLAEKIAATNEFSNLMKTARTYMFVYAILWFLSTIILNIKYFYMLRWLLLVSDIILLLIMLVGSVVFASKTVLQHKNKWVVHYMVVVTAMLVWNYASYFWGEASVYWGNSPFIRDPIDLTIIFWFVVNIATVIFIYKNDFVVAYSKTEEKTDFDLDKMMDKIAAEYELTAREKSLCQLIYEGNSNSQIAKSLFISESTVKTHVYNIFRKLGVKNRVGVTCVIRGEKPPESTDSE